MHHRLSAILGETVRLEDDEFDVADAWLDPENAQLRYVTLDLGGWFSDCSALLAAGALTPRDGRWTCALSRADVEGAQHHAEGGGMLDMASLPTIITGPFGYTVSPLLIAAGLRSEAADEAPPRRPSDGEESAPPTGPAMTEEAMTRRLVRWSEWKDAPVFGRDGEIGPLTDIMFDDLDWRPVRAVVQSDRGAVGLPWALVRRRVPEGGHIVMAVDARAVASAPDGLGTGTDVDEALMAHYAP